MEFILNDGGRHFSSHKKEKNDCTVRALAMAKTIAYDEAHAMLAAAGRLPRKGFAFNKFMKKQSFAKWQAFQAVKGQQRMRILPFCEAHPRGTYIVKVAKHVYAVIDGVVYDDVLPREDACIYGAWQIIKGIK